MFFWGPSHKILQKPRWPRLPPAAAPLSLVNAEIPESRMCPGCSFKFTSRYAALSMQDCQLYMHALLMCLDIMHLPAPLGQCCNQCTPGAALSLLQQLPDATYLYCCFALQDGQPWQAEWL